MQNRTSIRQFKGAIPDADIQRIIECGRRAPSSGNSQLCTLIEVKDQQLRKKITEICHNQEFVYDAAYFFVVCVDIRRMEKILHYVGGDETQHLPGTLRRLMSGIMDATVVAHNMVLAAEVLGYGSVYIGSVTTKIIDVSTLLNIPKGVLPVVGLAIGVPAEHPPRRPRVPLEMLWHIDQYRDPTPEEIDQATKNMDETLQQEGYFEKYDVLKKLYAEAPEGEYLWSTHMCNKFGNENPKEADRTQRNAVQKQGFLENF